MAAFERIHCGIDGLDEMFDNIRLGDNVVWQLTRLEDFHVVMQPYVRQAIFDGRDLIYIRFASHEPLLEPQPGLIIHKVDPRQGFERFTIAVRKIITQYGYDAFYVFDCLSELQTAWSTDLMMGNFFRVTCPYLFQLDTVAYFPILRGRHSFQAIAKIRETTQLFLEVYPDEEEDLYIQPLKVWRRYSDTMYLPHRFDRKTGRVRALTDGFDAARFYTLANAEAAATPDRNTDSWDRFFAGAQLDYARGQLAEGSCTRMARMMMSKDPKMRAMVERYFEPADYFEVRNRMVGTGLVGGKACGMLLARKIVEREVPESRRYMEPHDSFYLGSDVFYSYLVYNDLWGLRIEQRSGKGFIKAAPALREGLLAGRFPEDIRDGLVRMLEYYGQAPIIVRSSSFLEDGFGNAFAGKYESVFCANFGTLEERLEELESAMRTVYASTMDPSALEYRRRNGLDNVEEQMALLVQRVSGSHYGKYLFFPTAAGVGYSRSAYRWSEDIDPNAGMLRLVAGLGTKAVDRTREDYPRIVNLDRPRARLQQTWGERHRFSQRYVDVLDVEDREVGERPVLRLTQYLSEAGQRAIFEHDLEAERLLRDRGQRRDVLFASCQGLASNEEFCGLMQKILSAIERAYAYPVDIEFTVNVGDEGRFVVNLLQCRPLAMLSGAANVEVPDLPVDQIYFRLDGCAMGSSRATAIDAVIVVDPVGYYRCGYAEKPTVAALVGRVVKHYRETGRKALLMAPGRIGTSSPELGVPVSFADIAGLEGVLEVASSEAGYSPELSYGSHLFQDLVEAEIYYGALYEHSPKVDYDPGFVGRFAEVTERLLADSTTAKGIIHVYETGDVPLTLWHDLETSRSVCGTGPVAGA